MATPLVFLLNLYFQLAFSFRLSLSAAVNRIFSLCSHVPNASFRPLPATRPRLSDHLRRPAGGFKSVTCDPTAAIHPVCCNLAAPVGHFPASRPRISAHLLWPKRGFHPPRCDPNATFSPFPAIRPHLSARKSWPVRAYFFQTRSPTARFCLKPAVCFLHILLFLNPAPLLQYFLHLHSHLFHLQPYFLTAFSATSFLFHFTESIWNFSILIQKILHVKVENSILLLVRNFPPCVTLLFWVHHLMNTHSVT